MIATRVPAVVLAGGRSARLGGGDKCFLPLGGASILDHVLSALRTQAHDILINSNSAPELYAGMGLAVRADALVGRLGPLAGILTAMRWAGELGAAEVLTVPSDTPFLPSDLLKTLAAARRADEAAIAAYAGALHPTVGVWPVALAPRLQADIESGARKVRDWIARHPHAIADFTHHGADPFWNVNTPEDLAEARARSSAFTHPTRR